MSELDKKLGLAFKGERERRKLEIGELSDELKISVENLRAIENGDLDFLPSELYFKLFTKSYAERLGIDLIATIEAIKEELGISFDSDYSGEPVSPKSSDENDGSDTSSESFADEKTREKKWIPIAMGLTVLGGIIFGIMTLSTQGIVGNSSDSGDDAHGGYTEGLAEYRTMLANYEWGSQIRNHAAPLTISISSLDDSWATVLADSDTAIYRTIVPGRVFTAEAKYRFLVSIGIPSRVTVRVNGREVNLRDSVSRRISRVEVNQINKNNFPPGIPARKKSTPAPSPSNQDSSQSKSGE